MHHDLIPMNTRFIIYSPAILQFYSLSLPSSTRSSINAGILVYTMFNTRYTILRSQLGPDRIDPRTVPALTLLTRICNSVHVGSLAVTIWSIACSPFRAPIPSCPSRSESFAFSTLSTLEPRILSVYPLTSPDPPNEPSLRSALHTVDTYTPNAHDIRNVSTSTTLPSGPARQHPHPPHHSPLANPKREHREHHSPTAPTHLAIHLRTRRTLQQSPAFLLTRLVSVLRCRPCRVIIVLKLTGKWWITAMVRYSFSRTSRWHVPLGHTFSS